jgi:beta-1,4-mannosyltransferase
MQYHALSLAKMGYMVTLVGYSGSDPHERIRDHPNINFRYIIPFEKKWAYVALPTVLGRLLTMIVKVIVQVFELGKILICDIETPLYILVQTPPAIPALFIARIAAWFRSSSLVIDWHNFGYTIMALGPMRRVPGAIALARSLEWASGRLADRNLCVTTAMEGWLRSEWGVTASALHDQPAASFKSVEDITPARQHALMQRVQACLTGLRPEWLEGAMAGAGPDATLRTNADHSTRYVIIPSHH